MACLWIMRRHFIHFNDKEPAQEGSIIKYDLINNFKGGLSKLE